MHLHADFSDRERNLGFLTGPFVTALVLLGGAAVLVGPVATSMNFRQAKAALPLKKPLAELDEDALAPFRVSERHLLQPVVIEALGTDQYLDWTLEDLSVAPNDQLRIAHLFITYDTGGQNLVPHTPDECRLGAGYEPAQPHENAMLALDSSESDPLRIPVRICTFVRTAVFNRVEVTVVYTFCCDGAYAATRNEVRLLFNDPRNRFGYFSKVEVSFPRANREQNVKGAAKLMGLLAPVLKRDHWPDFAAAEKAAREQR